LVNYIPTPKRDDSAAGRNYATDSHMDRRSFLRTGSVATGAIVSRAVLPALTYAVAGMHAGDPESQGTSSTSRSAIAELPFRDDFSGPVPQFLDLRPASGTALAGARTDWTLSIPFDVDGDGRDEVLIGYSLWDHSGQQRWSHDEELKDHADAVGMGNFSGDPQAEPRAYASGSDEGYLVLIGAAKSSSRRGWGMPKA